MHARTVIVTGGARGLGREFALGFARLGERVVIADIDATGAEETKRLVEANGGTSLAVVTDVTNSSSAAALAEAAADFGGGTIDVLINNAAIYATLTRSPFEEIDEAEWDATMAVNLKGTWQVSRAVSPFLTAGSRIINLSSATVMSGSALWAHYVASKGGVIALTRVMAKELGTRGITVNAIAPGFTLTDSSIALIDNAETYGVERGAIQRASHPEDLVGTALFLASTGSDLITGQTIVVDGGRQFI